MKERIMEFVRYKGLPVSTFEQMCGLSNAYVKNISKGVGADKLEKILNTFPELNRSWLLYGEGDMLKENTTAAHTIDTTQNENNDNDTQHYTTLPLVPLSAIAGYNGWDNEGVALDDCPQYSIPDFIAVKAEFLIRVSGSSMYPKYSSGDILACRKVKEIRFIQWGKVYVIDGSQGMMVKRLFEIEDDEDNILCRSDNENYPPFKIPKDDIRSLSIVVGAIRLE